MSAPRAATKATRPRAELTDMEAYLRRSLDDLDRERAAGEIDDRDYEGLHGQYTRRLRAVESELALENERADAAASSPDDPAPGATRRAARAPRRPARSVILAAAVCFAAAAVIGGLALAGVTPFAKPAQQLSTPVKIAIELGEASQLVDGGHFAQAIGVYDDVLNLDPRQPEALADGGWLVRASGLATRDTSLVATGDSEIALSLQIDPSFELARAYEGITLVRDKHDAAGAVEQFNALAAERPPPGIVGLVAASARAAYSARHARLPAALAKQ